MAAAGPEDTERKALQGQPQCAPPWAVAAAEAASSSAPPVGHADAVYAIRVTTGPSATVVDSRCVTTGTVPIPGANKGPGRSAHQRSLPLR